MSHGHGNPLWANALLINSFVVWPIALLFFLYSAGRAFMTLDWKIVVIGFIIFFLANVSQIVLAILNE